MNIFNERNIRVWSTIGPRATLGVAALELAKTYNNLMVLTCDVSTSAGLDRYRKTYPEKYLDVGIAEQNMIGIAAGLASEDFKVITTTFAPFQTMRCCEQIKVNIGYMQQKICMVGIASGLALGTLGFTHCAIEDLSLMRSIPGMTVISPADCGEVAKSVFAAAKHKGPIYIRLTGVANNPIVYNDDYNFEIGKPIKLEEGNDVTIFATGSMVSHSVGASRILNKQNIKASVINIHTIKPLDFDFINKNSEKRKLIVTVEEHSVIGGLASAISEANSHLTNRTKQLSISLPDKYFQGGEYLDLLNRYNLNSEGIAKTITENLAI